jgi:hypothetical protein
VPENKPVEQRQWDFLATATALRRPDNPTETQAESDETEGAGLRTADFSVTDTEQRVPWPQPSLWVKGVQAWRKARASVDTQLKELQEFLNKQEDPQLVKIAGMIGPGMTKGVCQPIDDLVESLASGKREAKSTVRDEIREFRASLAENEQIEACDGNPFGKSMAIAAELEGGLKALEECMVSA